MTTIDRMCAAALERIRRSVGTRAGIASARIRKAAMKLRQKEQE